ncbi:MAG: HypC/HybG/HupF family hydrogenase formation chaperone [Chloroflexi bacterium]|nr:HypC/HybG/HupF family hydrogenase formation chaperone [Chloroflexota bacterium]
MCLAVPAKVVSIDGETALVELGGLTRQARTMLVPSVKVGDYVLLHAGFAIQTLDEAAAQETLGLLARMAEAGAGEA